MQLFTNYSNNKAFLEYLLVKVQCEVSRISEWTMTLYTKGLVTISQNKKKDKHVFISIFFIYSF